MVDRPSQKSSAHILPSKRIATLWTGQRVKLERTF
jgi:hypothetical protein